jgi:hypothetical protein
MDKPTELTGGKPKAGVVFARQETWIYDLHYGLFRYAPMGVGAA